jgi:hypothetical protein
MRKDALGVHNGKEKELRKYSAEKKQFSKNILFYEESL